MKINAIDNNLSMDKVRMNKLNMAEGPVSTPSSEEENYSMNGLELMGKNNIAFQGLNPSAMKAIKGTSLAAMMALLTLGATSCIEKDPEDTIVNVENKIDITIDNSEVVAELVALKLFFNDALDYLKGMDLKMAQIIAVLVDAGYKADQIIGLIGANNEQNSAIYDAILGVNKNQEEYIGLMNKVISLAEDRNAMIGGGNDLLTQILAMISEYGKQNNADNAQIIELLNSTLDRLAKMDSHQKIAFSKLLAAINANTKAINNNTAADKVNTQKIINAVNKVGAKVLERLDNLGDQAALIIDYLAVVVENQAVLGNKADKLIQIGNIVVDNQVKLGNKADAIIEISAYIANNVNKLGNKADKLINITANIANDVDKLGNKVDKLINIDSHIAQTVDKLGNTGDVVVDLLENLVELQERPISVNVNIDPVLDMVDRVLDKMDDMDGHQRADVEKLLAAINRTTEAVNNNTIADSANTQKILDAINGVSNIANMILDKMGVLGDKADTMIDLLAKIANRPTAPSTDIDLEDLKDFLKGLIATVNVNNNINTQAIIDAINAKDTGCTCDHSELLAKIEVIVEHLTDKKTGNEGIVEDLDNLFG